MRKFLLASAVSTSIALSGCGSITPGEVTSITTTLYDDALAAIVTGCNAVPDATALIALINQGVAQTAGALATAFCNAIESASPSPAPASQAIKMKALLRRFGVSKASLAHYCNGKVCGWK
jgi:hypothetical protein